MSTESDQASTDTIDADPPDIGRDATLSAEDSTGGRPSAPHRGGPFGHERIGRYRVVGVLGSGGMGRVYEAVDDRLDRRVAVKVLHHHLSEQHRRRLVREAQALARLSHPNVVHVYEIEEADGETFVAMELVRGQTLQAWARQEPRPGWRQCVDVYRQAGAGLAAAHAEGLVHRDFKPGNAIIDAKGRVRVLDFGLVRQAEEHEPTEPASPAAVGSDGAAAELDLTTTGTVLGTPAYMSLEQMSGGDVDARGDQFSFCVSLYEAIYGERPFSGNEMAALMVAMSAGRVQSAPKGIAVPAKLRQALLRGLEKEPERRWPAMEALLAELEGQSTPKTTRWLAIGLGGALVAVGLGAGYLASRPGPEAAQTEAEPNAADAAAHRADEQAKLLYGEGRFAYRKGLYDDAVKKWEEAYELTKRPLFLYDISMALEKRYESSGDVDDLREARSTMQRLVAIFEADPDEEGPDDMKDRITKLDAMITAAELDPKRHTAER